MRSAMSDTYNIGINALLMSGRKSYRSAGIHNYISGLLPHLVPADERLRHTIFLSEGRPELNGDTKLYYAGDDKSRPLNRVIWEQLQQPWIVRSEKVDLLHSMAFVAPVVSRVPSVVTVYDLSFLKMPGRFKAANRIYLSSLTARSCRQAERVIAISESTKRDVVEAFDVSPDKVDVVYPGRNEQMTRPSDAEIEAFRAKRGLPDRYIFYLGTIEPRKNLSLLINAYAKLRPKGIKLVCAGGKGWLYEDIFQTVEEMHLQRDVLFPGYVPQEEKALWYAASEAFVYPSIYEGFGIPVLEAMCCGVPAITTNASSLPEVAGDAAILFPPNDADALTNALDTVLNQPAVRQDMIAKGYAQANSFSWAVAGKLTAQTYAKALHLPVGEQA